jgi:hypothetical protein
VVPVAVVVVVVVNKSKSSGKMGCTVTECAKMQSCCCGCDGSSDGTGCNWRLRGVAVVSVVVEVDTLRRFEGDSDDVEEIPLTIFELFLLLDVLFPLVGNGIMAGAGAEATLAELLAPPVEVAAAAPEPDEWRLLSSFLGCLGGRPRFFLTTTCAA